MHATLIVRLRSTRRRLADTFVCLLFPGGRHVFRVLWSVEGYLFPHEAVLLHQIGRFASAGRPVVEIGSMRGLSTCCLASGLRRSADPSRVVAIDPHLYRSEPEFRENLRKFGADAVVDVRVARAEDAARDWNEEISAVFIDGAHDLQSAVRDFETWTPRVRPGGFVLIHDSTPLSKFPGPAFVADTYVRVGPQFDAAGRVGSISWGRKAGGGNWLPKLPGAELVDRLIGFAKRGRSDAQG